METVILRPDFSRRNAAIDILRALTMLLMIFVNDLWTIEGYPSWLGHAEGKQDFLGLADTVFPCFLFVVGMSVPYAIEKRFASGRSGISTVAHILTRTLALLLMGAFTVNTEAGIGAETGFSMAGFRLCMVAAFFLVWNDYPRTENRRKRGIQVGLQVIGWIALVVLAVLFRDRDGGVFRARWWGILGLIGWAYLVAAFVYLFARDRMRYLLPAWLILLGLCLLRSGTRGGEALLALPRGNFLDALLELFHLGNGALAALAVGGVLLSVCHVKYFSVDKGKGYVAFVLLFILLLGVGFAAHSVWITSKIQATPPWVLYCSAISVGMYALLTFLVDKGGARWFRLIRVAGTATLTCYLMPYVAYSISAIFHIQLPEGMHAGLLGILSCVAFSLLMLALAWGIGKIGLRLKI